MVSSVVVTIEGVNLSEGYIVRELSIYYVGTKSTRHHHFNPPTNFHLNEDNRKTDAYTRKKLGGLGVFTVIPGGKPYEESAAADLLQRDVVLKDAVSFSATDAVCGFFFIAV